MVLSICLIILLIGFIIVKRALSKIEADVEKLRGMGFSDNEIDDIFSRGTDINTIDHHGEQVIKGTI